MARRKRDRPKPPPLPTPTETYTSPDGEHTLVLAGVLSPRSRVRFAEISDPSNANAAATIEDVRQGAIAFLFSALVREWTVSGVTATKSKPVMDRFKIATPAERQWILEVLRAHCAEWFLELRVP